LTNTFVKLGRKSAKCLLATDYFIEVATYRLAAKPLDANWLDLGSFFKTVSQLLNGLA
jgi:hypothetical protein